MEVKATLYLKFFLMILASCFAFGCSELPTVESMVGRYEGKTEYLSEQLILRADGTYQQRFESSEGEVTTNSGMWRIEYRNLEMDGWYGAFDAKELKPVKEPKKYHVGHCNAVRGILHWNEGAYTMRKID
jgi:hypothetical protein